MPETQTPVAVTGDEITFRLSTDGPDELLLVDFDHHRHSRRNLKLTDEQVAALDAHAHDEPDSFLDPVIDREAVEFAVVFDYDRADVPEHRKHDRTAIFDYGEGTLFVRLSDGTEYEFGICPELAKYIDEQAE